MTQTSKVLLLFLLSFCLTVLCLADKSEVIYEKKKVVIIYHDGTRKTMQKPLFSVDRNGSILVNSLKDTKYYAHAKACDKVIENGLLQCEEIRDFLSAWSYDRTDTNDLLYYVERNEKGVVVRMCTLVKNRGANFEDEQTVFEYEDDGQLIAKILYETPGKKFEGTSIYGVKSGYITHFNEEGDLLVCRPMQAKNYERAKILSDRIMNQGPDHSKLIISLIAFVILAFGSLVKKKTAIRH